MVSMRGWAASGGEFVTFARVRDGGALREWRIPREVIAIGRG